MNITLDGFLSGPGGELDWHFRYWTPEMAQYLQEQLALADTILMGRHTYQAMAAYWTADYRALSLSGDDIVFAALMHQYRKLVCSASLQHVDWHNSELIGSHTITAIKKIKQEPGKNIVLYGSASLLGSLAATSLVDEYLLWLHPVILGRGRPLFNNKISPVSLQLLNTTMFASGVALLHYRVLP